MIKFNYKREIHQNPYSGFMSFQHFNGEKLYSDCITGSNGTPGTETENYECYPVPDGVLENGRNEGWYPENTIVYIRVLWKEFEPRHNEFNYKFIENILNEAKNHNQVLAFRLMPHSTCARDDVPDWLKEIMVCPERPDGKRVKDSPKDPRYFPLFSNAVRAFGERFDSDETLYSMDISLAGAWGEGCGTDDYSKESLIDLENIYIKYFPNTILVGQLSNSELISHINNIRPVGLRGDGAGEPHHMNIYYPKWMENLPKDLWKQGPVSFESYWWISEWNRQGWDIDEIINKTLSWHLSSFNPKSFPLPYEWKDKIEYWISKMGYHYVIDSFDYKITNNELNLFLNIQNVGVAPIYTFIPLKIKLKNYEHEFIFDTDIDIRKWINKASEKTVLDLSGVPKGIYDLEIGITDNNQVTAYFAIDAEFDSGFYKLSKIEVK